MKPAVKTDRRILRSKQAITRAFLELFAEKDFKEMTINDIADRANVNRGTVYLHYVDKYDLLDKCIEEHIMAMISLCEKGEAEEPDQGLISDPQPVFDYLKDHFAFFSAMFSTQRVFVFRDRLQDSISVSIVDKMSNEEPRGDAESEMNAHFMASAFIGIVEWWVRRRMPHSSAFMADQVRRLFEKNLM